VGEQKKFITMDWGNKKKLKKVTQTLFAMKKVCVLEQINSFLILIRSGQ
jgi:hypothetical protein